MHPYPSLYAALCECVGTYSGEDGAEFRLRRAGRGFFAEFRWPGPRATVDVILFELGTRFLMHHDTWVFELGFRPAESDVGDVLSLLYTGELFVSPVVESFATLRFAGPELTYKLGLGGESTAKTWVMRRTSIE